MIVVIMNTHMKRMMIEYDVYYFLSSTKMDPSLIDVNKTILKTYQNTEQILQMLNKQSKQQQQYQSSSAINGNYEMCMGK